MKRGPTGLHTPYRGCETPAIQYYLHANIKNIKVALLSYSYSSQVSGLILSEVSTSSFKCMAFLSVIWFLPAS